MKSLRESIVNKCFEKENLYSERKTVVRELDEEVLGLVASSASSGMDSANSEKRDTIFEVSRQRGVIFLCLVSHIWSCN